MTEKTTARTRSAFGQFQLNKSGIGVGTDYTKVVPRASAVDMAAELREGATLEEVAGKYGIAVSTLRSRMSSAGFSITGHPRTYR